MYTYLVKTGGYEVVVQEDKAMAEGDTYFVGHIHFKVIKVF